MQDIQLLLEQYGGWLVFANVLVEQAGLPVPAYPMLIAAGALAGAGGWLTPWLAATVACLLADTLWYVAGRDYRHPGGERWHQDGAHRRGAWTLSCWNSLLRSA